MKRKRAIIKLIFSSPFSFFSFLPSFFLPPPSFSLLLLSPSSFFLPPPSFSLLLLSPSSSLLLSQNPEGLTLPGDADADRADRADERIEHRQELRVLRAARRQPLQARARARVRRSQAGAEMTVEVWFTLLMTTTIERKVKFEVLGMRNITKRTACAIPSLFPTSSPSHFLLFLPLPLPSSPPPPLPPPSSPPPLFPSPPLLPSLFLIDLAG